MPTPTTGRVLDFSIGQAHLSLRNRQLLVRRDEPPDVTVPIDEIAVVVLSSRQVTLSVAALDALSMSGASVIVCDERSLPSGLMLPLGNAGHFQHTRRIKAQIAASLPTTKRVWQEIVRAKVRSQGALLASFRHDDHGILAMAARVRSDDPENIEAQAAQRYWPALFGDDFRRRFAAPDQNALLNYGYAVLRASVGRAVCAAGLHPSIGVHHRSRDNPFCLADDLMEPYRPVIDGEVASIVGETPSESSALDPQTKSRLVGVLHEGLPHEGEIRPVMDWIGRSAASLARRLCGESDERVFFPSGLFD